jgi:adenosylmethionine-8-amino-7-oxononanoate aminotransferase
MLPNVHNVRVLGAIGVVEMKTVVDVAEIQQALIKQGVWLRPFGKLIYLMPPYIMTNQQLEHICCAIKKIIS